MGRKRHFTSRAFLFVVTCGALFTINSLSPLPLPEASLVRTSRQLQNSNDSANDLVESLQPSSPPSVMKKEEKKKKKKKRSYHHHPLVDPASGEAIPVKSAVFNYVKCFAAAFFVFLALAIICDDFLCPPIDVLCERFSIPDDIAGATLLAFGSSAPEIFMNVSATASGKVDLSLPAILGSAIIAFGFIPALCSFSVQKPMKLSTWPLLRDSGMFIVCLLVFWKQVENGSIDTVQSAELTSLYFVYLLTIFIPVCCCRNSSGGSYASIDNDDDDDDNDDDNNESYKANGAQDSSNPDEGSTTFAGRVLEILSFPIAKVFSLTVPEMPDDDDDSYKVSTPKVFFAIFMSLAWITILSNWAVEVAQMTSTTVGMSPTTAGATLLAFGAQVPDTFGSLAMARNGMPGGAVSNAVGSQVINISLGVGAPFLAYNIFLGKPVDQGEEGEGMIFLAKAVCVTILTFFLVTMPFFRWISGREPVSNSQLNKFGGSVLFGVALVCYVAFVREQEQEEQQ